jgi:polysaccharide pyruvyl transferase WcaK-like protein
MQVMGKESASQRLLAHDPGLAVGLQKVPTRILFLGTSFSACNMGLGALASGTMASVFRAFPKVQLCVLDYGKEPLTYKARYEARTVLVPLINIRFSKKFFLKNNVARLLLTALVLKLVPAASLRKKMLAGNSYLNSVREANLVISIAGGDSFSDIYGVRRLLYVALPQILALMLGKPLILLPQTYGPFESRLSRCVARYILRHATWVYSRDREGLEVVSDLLGRHDTRVRFAYDMGFALEPLPPSRDVQERLKRLKQKGRLVGFNVSGLLYMGGYRRNNMFGLKSDYPSLIRAILDHLIAKRGCEVLLVPHVFGDKEDSESDVPACKRIMSDCEEKYNGRLHYLEGNFDQHEIKYVIGQCDFFLGSRMHACIAALSQCVPAVGLAYSRKFAGVLDSVGGGARVVDLREAEEQQILAAIGKALQDKSLLRHELEERMPKIKASVLNLFSNDEFKQLLSRV